MFQCPKLLGREVCAPGPGQRFYFSVSELKQPTESGMVEEWHSKPAWAKCLLTLSSKISQQIEHTKFYKHVPVENVRLVTNCIARKKGMGFVLSSSC